MYVTALLGMYKFTPYGNENDWIEYAHNIRNEVNLPTYLYAEYRDKTTANIFKKLIEVFK